jgi:hypothetical protein
MNSKELLISALAISAMILPKGVSAENVIADTLNIGYCEGQAKAENDIIFNNATKVSACLLMPKATISHYASNQLSGVDFYIISKLRTDSIKVWVRSALADANLASATIAKSQLEKGWNRVIFTKPVDLASQDYYIGYTYYQANPSYVISTVGNDLAGSLFIQQDDGAWADCSADGHGMLVLEGLVTGKKLPQYDAEFESISLQRDSLKIGFPLGVSGIVKNYAAHPFKSLTIACTSEGMQPMTFNADLDSTISYREKALFHFNFKPGYQVQTENIKLKVTVNKEDGNADDNVDNANADLTYNVMNHIFSRKALVEEFSTEHCVHCPDAAARLTQALSEDENYKHVVALVRHCGFGTDTYTNAADDSLFNLYSIDYAPAFMFDRTKQGDDYYYNLSDYNDMKVLMKKEVALGTDIEMNTFAYYNATGDTLNVEVLGERNDNFNVENPLITVSLVENNVLSAHQRGIDGNKLKGYKQQHLVRDYNSVWGDALTFVGNFYDYKCRFHVDRDSFVNNNMYVAAYIDTHSDDRALTHIYNADQYELKYADSTNYLVATNIENASNGSSNLHVGYANGKINVEGDCKSYNVFSIDGRFVNSRNLQCGIYIVRALMNNGNTKTLKIFVK